MHPSFDMARIRIQQGDITRFSQLFETVPRYQMGQVIGLSKYHSFTRRFNEPQYLTVGNVVDIAEALGVEYAAVFKLVMNQIKAEETVRLN